jgi:hypothetical protein
MRIAAVVCALAFAGCAAMAQGWKEAQEGGAEPNREALPEGTGWHCTVASQVGWSGCERSLDDCKNARGRYMKEAMTQGNFGIKFGECMQAAQVMCTTHNEMKIQSDGTGKPEPYYDCMPDQMNCEHIKESRQKESKNSRVSKCFQAT